MIGKPLFASISSNRNGAAPAALILAFGLAATLLAPSRADTILFTNGDRYSGTVVFVNATQITFRSQIQGQVVLPRTMVRAIVFGDEPLPALTARAPAQAPGSAAPQPVAPPSTVNPNPQIPPPPADPQAILNSIRQGGLNSDAIAKVQEQYLTGMPPEVSAMFQQTVSGLLDGSVGIGDVRQQAADAARQIHELKADLGDEAGDLLDGYLFILENFLRRTAK